MKPKTDVTRLLESSSARTSNLRELLVVNCDLEPECMDSELRVALQWIAASELGLPALYFRKSKEKRVAKVGTSHTKTHFALQKNPGKLCVYFVMCLFSQFQRVVHLMSQKAWRIADLFSAVVQFCKLHEENEEEGKSLSSLFDWLLETL